MRNTHSPASTIRAVTRGINNHGDMVGGYSVPGQPRHALLIKDGKFIPLGPGTVLATNYSEAFKINDRGDSSGATLATTELSMDSC